MHSRLGGQHLWLSVLAVVVAESDANVVHPSWNNRFDSAIGISRVDVYDNDSPHQYRDALSAALLPRLCIYHPKHCLYGIAMRSYGFQPLFPGVKHIQYDTHGYRRLRGLWHICEDVGQV